MLCACCPSVLLIGGFSRQIHNRKIVCSTINLCKALGVFFVFRNRSLASAFCACFYVQRKSLCGLKNDVYKRILCPCCQQSSLLWNFLRQNRKIDHLIQNCPCNDLKLIFFCQVKFPLLRKEQRIHTCCALVVPVYF